MHIAPDHFLVSSAIALLIGGWSFLICYFLFIKIEALGCVLFAVLVLFNIYLIPLYGIGLLLILISSVVACLAAGVHWGLNSKYDYKKRGYGTFFCLHYLASQVSLIIAFIIQSKAPGYSAYFRFLESGTAFTLLFFVTPWLGLIPLYLFKTYRPRLGIDTHFPDAGNN